MCLIQINTIQYKKHNGMARRGSGPSRYEYVYMQNGTVPVGSTVTATDYEKRL